MMRRVYLYIGILLAALSVAAADRRPAVELVAVVPDSCVMFCQDCYRYTGGGWQPYSPPTDLPRLLFRNFPEIYSDTAYTWSDCNLVIRCVFAKSHKRFTPSRIDPLLRHHVGDGMVRWTERESVQDTTARQRPPDRFPRLSVADIDSLMRGAAAHRHFRFADGSMLSVQYFLPDSGSGPMVRVLLDGKPVHF